MLSKKYYRDFALIFARESTIEGIFNSFIYLMKVDNPNFSEEKFLDYVVEQQLKIIKKEV